MCWFYVNCQSREWVYLNEFFSLEYIRWVVVQCLNMYMSLLRTWHTNEREMNNIWHHYIVWINMAMVIVFNYHTIVISCVKIVSFLKKYISMGFFNGVYFLKRFHFIKKNIRLCLTSHSLTTNISLKPLSFNNNLIHPWWNWVILRNNMHINIYDSPHCCIIHANNMDLCKKILWLAY